MDGASLATPACSSMIQANAAAQDRHVMTPVIADTAANVDVGVMLDGGVCRRSHRVIGVIESSESSESSSRRSHRVVGVIGVIESSDIESSCHRVIGRRVVVCVIVVWMMLPVFGLHTQNTLFALAYISLVLQESR